MGTDLSNCCGDGNRDAAEPDKNRRNIVKKHTKNDEEKLSDLEKRAKEFKLSRFKAKIGTEESDWRTANTLDIMQKRWKWYQDNIELFSLVLQNNGFEKKDIECAINGTKPLGMKIGLYNDFKQNLCAAINKAKLRIKNELGNRKLNLRVILQGSYVVGYSSNPFKGDRHIPNWLFDPTKKSDYDFRCYGEGLDEYVEQLRNNGMKIEDRSKYNPDQYYMILPSSVGKVFPEFEALGKQFDELSKKHIGKKVRLQISVVTKNINFEPNPWDMEINME
eukprot:166717_1